VLALDHGAIITPSFPRIKANWNCLKLIKCLAAKTM
jgi:hypothetical protein